MWTNAEAMWEKIWKRITGCWWKRTHYKKKSFKKCENTSSVEMLDVFIFVNLGAILILLLYNCLLLYLIKKITTKKT